METKKEKNNMTNKEIIKDILESYCSNSEWQSEIAERYNVSKSVISALLQVSGFHYHKHNDSKSIDIDLLSQNPEVQKICEKLRQSM